MKVSDTESKRSVISPNKARPGASSRSGSAVATVVLTMATYMPSGTTRWVPEVHDT